MTGIQALTYQDGGVPIYHHHMYVDSSPRVADVDFSDGAGTDWRTIVVGGLGKGGNSYYALDLTSPTAGDESAAAAKVLWEWDGKVSGVQEVRYSYGRPVIVKVRDSSYAMGRWVVIVTGGYNNVTGLGKVFFLDATDGALISTVTTSAGIGHRPERTRADPRLRQEPEQPDRRTDLRRRPAGQPVAHRRVGERFRTRPPRPCCSRR